MFNKDLERMFVSKMQHCMPYTRKMNSGKFITKPNLRKDSPKAESHRILIIIKIDFIDMGGIKVDMPQVYLMNFITIQILDNRFLKVIKCKKK